MASRAQKLLLKLLLGCLLGPIGLVLLLLLLLQAPPVRQWALREGLDVLAQQTGYRLEVGALERLDPWGLTARDLRLVDDQGRELGSLERLWLTLRPGSALTGALEINRVHLRGLRIELPDPTASPAEPEPEPPAATTEESSSFEIRVREARVEDARLAMAYAGTPYRADVSWLEASGRWSDVPLVAVRTLRGRVSSHETELLTLITRAGTWDSEHGGMLELDGLLVGGPLSLRAEVGPLLEGALWPDGQVALRLEKVTRGTLRALGVPDGADLRGAHELDLQLVSRDESAQATLRIDRRLQVEASADRKRAQATLELEPMALSELSGLLPGMRAKGTLTASYAYEHTPSPLMAHWRGVALDGQAIPNGRVDGEIDGSRLSLEALTLEGFEAALSARGDMNFETGKLSAEVSLQEFGFARIPWLHSLGVRGVTDAELRFQLSGKGDFASQGFVSWRGPGYAQTRADRLQLALALYGELAAPRGEAQLVVQRLSAGKLALERLAADFNGDAQHIHASLKGHGSDSAFRLLLEGSRPSPGTFELKANGGGRLAGLPLRLRLSAFAEQTTEAVTGDLWLASGSQRLRGHLDIDRAGRFDATLEAQSLKLETWTELAAIDGVTGHVEGFVHCTGTTQRPLVNVKLTAASVRARDLGPYDLMVNLETDLARGKLSSDIEVRSDLDRTRVNANVRAKFPAVDVSDIDGVLDRADYELTLRSELPIERFAHYGGPRVAALRGTLATSIDAHGNLDDPHVTLSLSGRVGLPADTDEPEETVYAKAVLTPEDANIEVALKDLGGALLSAKASSSWPAGALRDTVDRVAADLSNLPKFQLKAYLAERRLDRMQGAVAYLAGVYQLAVPVRARAELDLHGEGKTLDGTARMELLIFGDQLDADCALGAQSRLDVDAELAQNQIQLKLRAYTEDGGELSGELHSTLGSAENPVGATRVALEGKRIALAKLPGLCDLSDGVADLSVQAEGLGDRPPRVALALKVSDLRTAKSEPLALALRADWDGKLVRATSDLVVHGQQAGKLSATLPVSYVANGPPSLSMQAPIKAQLSLKEIPLAPFLSLGEQLGRTSGKLSAELQVEGTLERPRPRGFLEIKQASVALASLAQPFHRIDARVDLEPHRIFLRSLSTEDLGGKLKLSGEAQYADDFSGRARLQVEADQFPLRRQGVVVGEVSTRAKIEADLSSDLLTDVRVRVAEGRVWLTGETGRAVQALEPNAAVRFIDAPTEELPTELSEDSEGVRLRSLKLASEKEIWLMHKDFSVQVGFDIRLSEEHGPTLEGEARLKRGDFKLLGKSFSIQKGAIRFTGDAPPDPELDLRAVYKPSTGEDLIVQITGRASAPGLTFSGAADNAGDAMMVLSGRGKAGAESQAQADAAGFAASVTAGLLSVTARRELGDWVPMLSVETDPQGTPSRAAAGFDASKLIPPFLDGIAKGAYVEGVVGATQNNNTRGSSVGLGVRLELSFPRDLVTTFGYGPGPNWSTDVAWAP